MSEERRAVMNEEKFYIGDALRSGWEAFKENLGLIILFLLILWVVQSIVTAPFNFSRNSAVLAVGNVLGFIVGIFVSLATIKFSLRLVREHQVDLTDLYTGYPRFLNMLLGSILYGLIVIGGLILLIVPGIYWGLKYQFFGYLIVEQDLDAIEAIKKSGRMTKGQIGHLLLYALAAFGLNLAGVIACCVGVIITIPVTLVAHGYIYARLVYFEDAGAAAMPGPQGYYPPAGGAVGPGPAAPPPGGPGQPPLPPEGGMPPPAAP